MKNDEYRALSARLHSIDDVRRIAKEEGYHEDMLLVIYSHRVTRNATKNFYKVKAKIPHLVKEWEQGTTLFDLARRYDFPPVLMAFLVMMEKRIGRKLFWKYIRDPRCIQNRRVRAEIQEVVAKDYIYSPTGTDIQVKRGKDGESTMAIILDHYKIQYLVEKELRGVSTKTPDFLLHRPLIVDGKVINWIESKANFGDLVEVRRNQKKQLSAYLKLFGPGMVVYWFGYVDDAPQEPDIIMADGTFIEELFATHNWGKRVKVHEAGESPTKRLRRKGSGEVPSTTLEDFEAGFAAPVVEEVEDKGAERDADEAVHAYTHASSETAAQAHASTHPHDHSQAHIQSQGHPQQHEQGRDRPRDRRGRGRGRRGRDRRREREGSGGQRNVGGQPQGQHGGVKKSKGEEHDWTLDLM